jgi:hypothetical protein
MKWPGFKNGYNNADGCACHGQTFCPHLRLIGYDEENVPVFEYWPGIIPDREEVLATGSQGAD